MNNRVFSESKERFRFAERLRYQGVWVHDCWADHEYFQLELGDISLETIRSTYNGTPQQFERDVAGRLNTLSYERCHAGAPPRSLVAAFNIWRFEKHEERVQRILGQPNRYGVMDRDDPFLARPSVAVPGHYEHGVGWIRGCTEEEAIAEAGLVLLSPAFRGMTLPINTK